MNKIVILNPKGGCGKTTLATNVASVFALRGPPPTLIDTDPRGYTARWLERRPTSSSRVNGIVDANLAARGQSRWQLRAPRGGGAVIIDTPAGLGQREIGELTYDADCILIPVLPSEFDIQVTTRFVAELLLLTQFDRPIAVVANRTRENTKSLARLLAILQGLETPTVAVLRNSQNYVRAADMGLGICELPHHQVRKDLAQFELIVNWLDGLLSDAEVPGLLSKLIPLPKLFASSERPYSD